MFGNACSFEGRIYLDGAYYCDDERCLECNDGQWHNPDEYGYGAAGLVVAPGRDLT